MARTHKIAVIMGSDSDWKVLSEACTTLDELGISHEVHVLSAHRMPDEMSAFAKVARERGIQVIIAGAGGAAHLPGMVASYTTLPVIGVPIPLKELKGLDSLLSIAQMPAGVPVATVGIGNARNAALLAARMISIQDPVVAKKLEKIKSSLRRIAIKKGKNLASVQKKSKKGTKKS